jgi:hypothetical protein
VTLRVVSEPWPPPPPLIGPMALALKECEVDFVVIGGAAAQAWGASRRPSDFDVVIRCAAANFEAAAEALRALKARAFFPRSTPAELALLPSVRLSGELVGGSPVSTWITAFGELDLFDSVLTRDGGARYWEDLAPNSTPMRFGGITADVASLDTIISTKRAVGRPKDLETVAELRRIAAHRALRQTLTQRTCHVALGQQPSVEPTLGL